MSSRTWTVARQIAFFPTERSGKLHAAWKVSGQAACKATLLVQTTSTGPVIRTAQGDDSAKVHPMVCKRCLYLTTSSGYTAAGFEQ